MPYQEKLVVQQRVGNELKMQIYLKIIKENVAALQENREENRPKTLLKEKNIENTLEWFGTRFLMRLDGNNSSKTSFRIVITA